MSRRTQENLVALALLAIFGAVLWLTQDFGPRARMIPLPLAVFGIVLTLVQLVWQNLRSTDELQMNLISVSEAAVAQSAVPRTGDTAPPTAFASRPEWRRELRAYGIVALLLALIVAVGLIPAVFFFTAGYFAVARQYSWTLSIIFTALFTALVYVLFFVALQIEPYHGLLTPLVEQLR